MPELTRPLLEPYRLRGVTLRNRLGISPMCTYAADDDGLATDFHLVHAGRFALGGAGLVVLEATAIERRGRISHHDLGLWSDEHADALAPIARFLAAAGAVAGIQLGHAGRRGSVREPWFDGAPLGADDPEPAWELVAPSASPAGPGFPTPRALSIPEIDATVESWVAAARRAVAAGFRWLELHGAHGYLLHEFLSPVANTREDRYGGDAEGRLRYPRAVVAAVRAAIPDDVVLAYRISALDPTVGGLTLDDTVEAARELVLAGVDIVDTSSGGISTDRTRDLRVRRGFAFHADFSRAMRSAGIPAATVGLVVDPEQAARLVEAGDADLVLLGRGALDDPNWAVHARRALLGDDRDGWHERFGSHIAPWTRLRAKLQAAGESPLSRFTADDVTAEGSPAPAPRRPADG